MTDKAMEAALRVINALDVVEKAKNETHPSFKDAMRAMTYHELTRARHEGAEVMARALLSAPDGREAAAQMVEAATDILTEAQAANLARRIRGGER